jgi:hypothetical protein
MNLDEYGDTDTKFESKLMPIIGEYVKNVPISKVLYNKFLGKSRY